MMQDYCIGVFFVYFYIRYQGDALVCLKEMAQYILYGRLKDILQYILHGLAVQSLTFSSAIT